MARTIPLTQGYTTIVDDADYAALSAYRWKALKAGKCVYAARTVRSPGASHNDVTLLMHRVLFGTGAQRVDHINHDSLDNRRCNLRAATASTNAANSPLIVRGTPRFKGVYWNKKDGKWQAQIGNGKAACEYLGQFDSEVEAASAYNAAARQRFGQFAVLNSIPKREAQTA